MRLRACPGTARTEVHSPSNLYPNPTTFGFQGVGCGVRVCAIPAHSAGGEAGNENDV